MNQDVPYMMSVTNVPKILDAIQKAAAPETFHRDFLKDLGFKASNDRGAIKLLKYLGLLDPSGKPQTSYRDFMDQGKAKKVLAGRLRSAYDDLFTADKQANAKSVDSLKGWFKTKTGAGDAVAQKMASTFRSLAQYADFDGSPPEDDAKATKPVISKTSEIPQTEDHASRAPASKAAFGLVYRFEVHLPDTQNVDTSRAIFRALRAELL
jgi:hypothetical protein